MQLSIMIYMLLSYKNLGRFSSDSEELMPKPDLYKTMSGIQRWNDFLDALEGNSYFFSDLRLCRKWAKAGFGDSLQLYVYTSLG